MTRQLKILLKGSLLLGSVLIMLALFGCLGFWAVSGAKKETQLFTRIAVQTLARAGEINSYQAEGYARTLQLLNADTPEERSAWHAAIDEYRLKTEDALNDYTAAISTDESRRNLEDLTEKRRRYHQIRQQVMELSDQGKKGQALDLVRTSLWPAYEQYTQAGDVLFASDIAAAQTHADHVRSVCTISQVLAACVGALGFIGGIALPFFMVVWAKDEFEQAPDHRWSAQPRSG